MDGSQDACATVCMGPKTHSTVWTDPKTHSRVWIGPKTHAMVWMDPNTRAVRYAWVPRRIARYGCTYFLNENSSVEKKKKYNNISSDGRYRRKRTLPTGNFPQITFCVYLPVITAGVYGDEYAPSPGFPTLLWSSDGLHLSLFVVSRLIG